MSFRLKMLIKSRERIFNFFNKMLNKLEKNNEELFQIKMEAIQKISDYEEIVNITQKQINENKKSIKKISDIIS